MSSFSPVAIDSPVEPQGREINVVLLAPYIQQAVEAAELFLLGHFDIIRFVVGLMIWLAIKRFREEAYELWLDQPVRSKRSGTNPLYPCGNLPWDAREDATDGEMSRGHHAKND